MGGTILSQFFSLVHVARYGVENCFVCALSPINYLVILPVEAYCKHIKKDYDKSPRFKKQPKVLAILSLIGYIFALGGLLNIYYYIDRCKINAQECFMFVSDIVFVYCGVLIGMFSLYHINDFLIYLNGWVLLVSHCNRKSAIPVLITKNDCCTLARLSFLFHIGYYFFYASHFFVALISYPLNNEEISFIITGVYSSGIQYLATTLTTIVHTQFSKIMKNLQDSAMEILNERRAHDKYNDTTEKLRKVNRFYMAIVHNFQFYRRFMTYNCFIWFTSALLSLISNFYLTIKEERDIWDLDFRIVFLELRNYVLLITLMYFIVMAEKFSMVRIF